MPLSYFQVTECVSLQVVAECVVLVSIVLLFASLSPGIFRMLASAKKSAVHVREPL